MGQEYADILDSSDLSLLETIDHVLNRGLVITGDITISVADIDLIYLGLNVVLGSVDTIAQALLGREDSKTAGRPADHLTVDGPNRDDT
jgi:hypothetical protein